MYFCKGKGKRKITKDIWNRMLLLDYYIDGIKYEEVIGETEGHGKWFEWRI